MRRITGHFRKLTNYLLPEQQKEGQADDRFIVTMQREENHSWHIASIIKVNSTMPAHALFRWRIARMRRSLQQLADEVAANYKDSLTVVLTVTCNPSGYVQLEHHRIHFRNSKWSQYALLKSNNRLAPYLPPTELYTPETVRDFLQRYKEVLLKPCIGQEGKGIIQVIRQPDESFAIHQWNEKYTCASYDELFERLASSNVAKKPYIVQQKLRLAEIGDCPIDLRVVVQKDENRWVGTGMLVKVAAKDFFVTNVAQHIMPFEEGIRQSSIARFGARKLKDRLYQLCLAAARQLEQVNPAPDIIGYDIGITQCGKIFILEGNYVPDLAMFHSLEDQKMYWTIKSYQLQNEN
ncbi:YheC/YheD family protein [Sporosarcina sp. NCCP-2222]|uniref:YheC/YheD family protein n=1 Tax=Sporosarcina sp. NCCP-2222 TaxID=2935073 RepID=UPI0020C0E264|nr:YheC/YheD family protein [Sporosarcina sp. NCCP-2222]